MQSGSSRDAEANVSSAAVGCIGATRVNAVAPAVALVAEIAPAAHDSHLAGDRASRRRWRRLTVVVCAEPVGAPLPHVAGHLIQSEVIGRVAADWARPDPAISTGVATWE